MEIISLTLFEKRLFDFLLDIKQKINGEIVLRVCGGWVRDKLLGRENDDIDITIDKMTGKEFICEAKKIVKSLRFGIVEKNTEKSKHLECVVLHFEDQSIDFVNLRTETYTSESRIPETLFGTPEQDA